MTRGADAPNDRRTRVPDNLDLTAVLAQLPFVVLIVAAYSRGWVVTSARFAEMREDRDFWRGVALRAIGVAEQTSKGGR